MIKDIDIQIMGILFGGFAMSGILAIAALFTRYDKLHMRWAMFSAGVIPILLLAILWLNDLLVSGRSALVLFALTPILYSIISPIMVLKSSIRRKKVWECAILLMLFFSSSWSAVILFLMTDTGFMGASC